MPKRRRGKGSGKGRAHGARLRAVYMKLLTLNVHPNAVGEVFATIAEEILGEERCVEQGMELPGEQFVRDLRAEIGAVHMLTCGLAFADADRVHLQGDESPLDQRSFLTTPMRFETTVDGAVRRRDWSSGAFEIHDKTAVGEARAFKEKVIDRFRAGVESLRSYLVRKVGAAGADAVLPAAGGVAARKIATFGTDNAAAALLSHEEIKKIVEEDVIAHIGADEWAKLSDDEKRPLTKVWGTTCMRHLANTFIDGGVKRDAAWLDSKLADSIAAAPWRLRLSGDLNKLFHACAKGLGEGINLYGKGVGASRYRPFLKKNFAKSLHLKLERFDKGARQDGATMVRPPPPPPSPHPNPLAPAPPRG